MDGATEQLVVMASSSKGSLLLYRGSTLIAEAAVAISEFWACLELRAVIHASAGSVQLWVDGVLVLSFNGDTLESSTARITGVRIGAYRAGGRTYHQFAFDDLAINDTTGAVNNGRIGCGGVYPLYPVADTDDKGFSRSAGADNYALVDDTTVDGDTTYVQANSVGVRDLYRVTSLSGYGAVACVGIAGLARASGGAGAVLQPTLLINSTTVLGSTTLVGTYAPFQTFWENNPATSNPWSGTAVNSALIGMTIG
jgi:hypothetical protein